MKRVFGLVCVIIATTTLTKAQSTNDILNLLITNKTITQSQADSIRAEAAIKQQDADVNKKTFFVSAAKQLQLAGYAQMRYQNLDEKGKIDGFDIRRARLDLKGTITPYWNIRFQVDLAGTAPKLLDAYGECKIIDFFNLTMGQFKLPFSMENLASSSKLELIDRSQVIEALVARGKDVIGNQNGRDIGIQVSGSFLKVKDLPLFDYALGVFNGAGINVSDKNEAKSVAGRLVFHPLKGFDVGSSYYTGWDNFGSTPTNQKRERLGFELKYDLKKLSLKGEFIQGKDGSTGSSGWYAQSGYYIIPQKFQLLLKYDTFDPNTSTPKDVTTNYTIVVNYAFNSWSKVQVGYVFREEEGPSVNNNLGVIQYQIGF
jgi:phosphate-selective porin OprO/OprP